MNNVLWEIYPCDDNYLLKFYSSLSRIKPFSREEENITTKERSLTYGNSVSSGQAHSQ